MRQAVCNELFGKMEFSKVCHILSENGFSGVEIALFTLTEDPGKISSAVLRQTREAMSSNGMEFAGFHWLFAKPAGLHFTSENPSVRSAAQEHLKRLLWAAGELGGGNLIFGSPKQREIIGLSSVEGMKYFIEGLENAADDALQANSTICLEALSHRDTNILNTLEEVSQVVQTINHPAVQGMFDFHNCADEVDPWEILINNYSTLIKHVHLNKEDGSHPGEVDADEYKNAFNTLIDLRYKGWVSLEIFSLPENPEQVIRETAGFLKKVLH
ncbi:MAG: sugar phosphate isomerase/epimerase [Bacteroidetes bacterium]|nr:sugar phosphate isomerase/epimerase [Bacteroidota bacterium]